MNILVRNAHPSEAIKTTIIRRDSWLSAYSHIFSKEAIINHFESKIGNPKYKKQTKQIILNKKMHVAIVDGNLAAMMVIDEIKPRMTKLEVHALYVSPNFQRNGLGKILMTKAIDIAKANNIHLLNWFALKDNIVGNSFYQKLGAKIVSQKTNTLCGKEVELVEYNLGI